ncbi:reverse transcriptase [Gossypium australe]|uniref:Reverse transcriptase n=1 Tax=Gossypium australe TaxID=47621 RepID=A0A5B6VJN6_9ROSI|nr:reverse transcriptase [Gossypium australe]
MKRLCWNVRGLRSPRAVRRLRHMLKLYNPHIVFLMEMKLDYDCMEKVRRMCHDQSLPWLMCGDFNEIFYSFEKKMGVLRDEQRMSEFRVVNSDYRLDDLGVNYFSLRFGGFFRSLVNWKFIEDDRLVSDKEDMLKVATTYFEGLFTSQGVDILFALKSMALTKASGLDGLLTLFYKKYWHIVGLDGGEYYLGILNGGMSFAAINITHIVLILKVLNPTCMQPFRPINLCCLA